MFSEPDQEYFRSYAVEKTRIKTMVVLVDDSKFTHKAVEGEETLGK